MVAFLGLPDFPPLGILFAPGTAGVIDIFRALGDFEDHYDVAALDALEARLGASIPPEIAKGLVSDCLLLAFGLRRERPEGLEFRPVGSRRGSLDEYCLAALIAAAYRHDFTLAQKAALSLNVAAPRPVVSLAFDIARRLEAAGLELDPPDARLLAGRPPSEVEVERSGLPRALQNSFEF